MLQFFFFSLACLLLSPFINVLLTSFHKIVVILLFALGSFGWSDYLILLIDTWKWILGFLDHLNFWLASSLNVLVPLRLLYSRVMDFIAQCYSLFVLLVKASCRTIEHCSYGIEFVRRLVSPWLRNENTFLIVFSVRFLNLFKIPAKSSKIS